MIRVKANELKTCKMSELAEIAQSKTIGLLHTWDKGMETALVEKVDHIRYSFNPKRMMDKHRILYSCESVAMSPKHAVNDRDEVLYFEIADVVARDKASS